MNMIFHLQENVAALEVFRLTLSMNFPHLPLALGI